MAGLVPGPEPPSGHARGRASRAARGKRAGHRRGGDLGPAQRPRRPDATAVLSGGAPPAGDRPAAQHPRGHGEEPPERRPQPLSRRIRLSAERREYYEETAAVFAALFRPLDEGTPLPRGVGGDDGLGHRPQAGRDFDLGHVRLAQPEAGRGLRHGRHRQSQGPRPGGRELHGPGHRA